MIGIVTPAKSLALDELVTNFTLVAVKQVVTVDTQRLVVSVAVDMMLTCIVSIFILGFMWYF